MKTFRIVYRIDGECFSKANDTIKYPNIGFSLRRFVIFKTTYGRSLNDQPNTIKAVPIGMQHCAVCYYERRARCGEETTLDINFSILNGFRESSIFLRMHCRRTNDMCFAALSLIFHQKGDCSLLLIYLTRFQRDV